MVILVGQKKQSGTVSRMIVSADDAAPEVVVSTFVPKDQIQYMVVADYQDIEKEIK